MKLSQLNEDKIPSELRDLSINYWNLRSAVFKNFGRIVEPYICNLISKKIGDYLIANNYSVQYIRHEPAWDLFHIWLIASKDGNQYVIDGSEYQFFYDKPIGTIVSGRIKQILLKYDITNLAYALTVIDIADGHGSSWTDAGAYDLDFNYDNISNAIIELGNNGINYLRGRLLPMMLSINPIDHVGSEIDIDKYER